MKTALGFVSIIFTMGRYLLKQYRFLVEFNVVLAFDLSNLYQRLKLKINEEFCLEHA
jgi:hypothetical protein